MNYKINNIFKFFDLFDYLKIYKDKYFKNPIAKELEEKRRTFYSQFIKEGDICFDIGANYGNRTEVFLKLGAKVIAVEPQPEPANFLKRKFGNSIVLIEKAIGAERSKAVMHLSLASALSSLSEEWIKEVQKKRFNKIKWNKKIEIEVTTIDDLINQYGRPAFCKIDVEGYEYEVLKGFSGSVDMLSFEYTIPELLDRAIQCINLVDNLGKVVFNYSPGETLQLELNQWLNSREFILLFKSLPSKGIIDGDIYAKFITNNS